MQNQYAKLLSPHFEGDNLENLLKIIGIMQDPDSFEFGISQLHALDLYDPFVQFLKDYILQYGVDWDCNDGAAPSLLIEYMFAKNMDVEHYYYNDTTVCSVQSPKGGGSSIEIENEAENENENEAVIFPLFCGGLQIVNVLQATFEKDWQFQSNIHDIEYTIQVLHSEGGVFLKGEYSNVKKMCLSYVCGQLEQKHFPNELEFLLLEHCSEVAPNALCQLSNLKKLVVTYCSISNLIFPPNIESITITGINPFESTPETLENILKNNPKLQQLTHDSVNKDAQALLKQYNFMYNGTYYERALDSIQ